jgi:GTP cyclohydrolase I
VSYEQNLEEIVNGALFASDNDEMVILKHRAVLAVRASPAALYRQGPCGLYSRCWACRRSRDRGHVRPAPADPGKPHAQIADAIQEAAGVAVVIEANMCMMMRGVENRIRP